VVTMDGMEAFGGVVPEVMRLVPSERMAWRVSIVEEIIRPPISVRDRAVIVVIEPVIVDADSHLAVMMISFIIGAARQ